MGSLHRVYCFLSDRRMRFWQSSSLHIWTQLHYVLIEYSPSVWLANIQKRVIKQLTCDLTLSKLTCTAHGNNLFHWTLINLLSPTSINEKITYVSLLVFWRQKIAHPTWQAIATPKSSSLRELLLHTTSVWIQDLFVVPGTQKGSIPVNGHHPAPNPFLDTACNTPKKSTQPQVVSEWCNIILKVHSMPKASAHPQVEKNNVPTSAGLTHTSDSNSTLDRRQQAGRNFFGGQYISNGSLLQTVQNYPLLFFSLTAQLGHILVVPKHKFFCVLL
jgi:hypothetical protein